MNINFTLILQFAHFFVAYLLIRSLLVKPAMKVIEREHEEFDHLTHALEIGKKIIVEREREKQRRWEQCQVLFSQNIPGKKEKGIFHFEEVEMGRPALLSREQLVVHVHDLEKAIVEKVKHVR